ARQFTRTLRTVKRTLRERASSLRRPFQARSLALHPVKAKQRKRPGNAASPQGSSATRSSACTKHRLSCVLALMALTSCESYTNATSQNITGSVHYSASTSCPTVNLNNYAVATAWHCKRPIALGPRVGFLSVIHRSSGKSEPSRPYRPCPIDQP